jgi:hypothetical protein
MIQGSGRCHYHPDRAGLGVCVECRRVICVECTTQFEGINRCARCLARRLASVKEVFERRDWTSGNLLLALISVGSLFGAVYLLVSLLAS